MFLGLLMLIDSPFPTVRIDTGLAASVAVSFGLVFVFLMRLALKAFSSPVQTGNEGLVGAEGVARSNIDAEGGKVFVHGEWWNAASEEPIGAGCRVRVVKAKNLKLMVEKGN